MEIEEAKRVAMMIQRAESAQLVLNRLATIRERIPIVYQIEGLVFVGRDAEELVLAIQFTLEGLVAGIHEQLAGIGITFPRPEGTEAEGPAIPAAATPAAGGEEE